MRFTRGYKSSDVDDRRADPVARGGGGLGGGGVNLLGALFRRFGLPGVLVGAALLYFGGGLSLGPAGESSPSGASARGAADLAAEPADFVSFVFDDAQSTWTREFRERGVAYEKARMVLFRERTNSQCGLGEAAMGPFYCPADRQVYIDLSFYEDLKRSLGAPGDFAQAYVIAHEVGHHVQHLLGHDQRVHSASRRDQAGESGLLVRLELQADCFAGVWAHGTERRELLETGDLEEALNAASKIGDDALQRQATGVVRPESFTHGTSAQRRRWFQRGFADGKSSACDTFGAATL